MLIRNRIAKLYKMVVKNFINFIFKYASQLVAIAFLYSRVNPIIVLHITHKQLRDSANKICGIMQLTLVIKLSLISNLIQINTELCSTVLAVKLRQWYYIL